MSENTELTVILTADQLKTAQLVKEVIRVRSARAVMFGQLQRRVIDEGEDEIRLRFEDFGDEWCNVSWIAALGFSVHRNEPCQWWEVRWQS